GADGLRLVVRGGQSAPGYPATQPFSNFLLGNLPRTSRGGHTAFIGSTLYPPNLNENDPLPPVSGIWTDAGGAALQLVAKEKDQAPGAAAGQYFQTFFQIPAVGNAGDVAFVAQLAGTGITGSSNQGVWTWRNGALQPVARLGQQAANSSSVLIG